MRGQLGVFAAAAYRSGGIDSTLQLMLSEDPANFLDQSTSLDAVARGQQAAMRRVAAAQQQLDQSKARARPDPGVQEKAEAEAAAQTRAINAQGRRGAAPAELPRGRRARPGSRPRRPPRVPPSAQRASRARSHSAGSPVAPELHAARPRAARPRAVAYARAQVGKSYTWGAAGPNSFDCSGLTMRAWGQAGVSLPHYTNAQYAATRHVSHSEMQPGDLIFFHSPTCTTSASTSAAA